MVTTMRRSQWLLKLLLAACLSLVTGAATLLASEVTKINKKKSLVMVSIDEGTKAKKGWKVCFKDASDQPITCGKVVKVNPTSLVVKVPDAEKLAMIKKGFPAEIKGKSKGGDTETAGEGGASSSADAQKMALKFLWLPAFRGPTTFTKAGYVKPKTVANPAANALWEPLDSVSTAFMSFGGSATIPLGSFAITPGLRYRSYTATFLETDYDPNDTKKFAQITQKMSTFGLWTDFRLFHAGGFYADSGLDIEMSTLTLAAKMINETTGAETDLTSATSKLNVISLRLGTGYDLIFMGPAGLNLGLNIILPLVAMGKSFSADVSGDPYATRSPNAASDLEAALGHKKNSLGIEIAMGLALAF